MKRLVLALLAPALLAAPAIAQNRIGTGQVSELYQNFCANCHGANLEGGQGSSLIDGIWTHGGSDDAIAASIRNGVPGTEMIAWGSSLTDAQIRALVIYIREQTQAQRNQSIPKANTDPDSVYRSEEHSFRIEKVGEGDGILWAVEFLDDGSLLATQRDGKLWRFRDGVRTAIEGIPKVWQNGQGGLMEVQKHPDYASNGWIYLGYSEHVGAMDNGREAGMTCIVRGRIDGERWIDEERIFNVPSDLHLSGGAHFGTRFVLKDGYLFFGIGDRGRQEQAQDLSRPNGKIHRIHDDGRVPNDNPFRDVPGAFPTIWSYGHRNPQGLDAHPETGDIWEVEHGPRGGDEVNLIQRAANYGWPVITYGMNYNGTPITDLTAKDGMLQPKHFWVPSIAICGVDFYEGNAFPRWRNNLFVSGLASQELHRLVIENGEVVHDEIVFKGLGRIRDVGSGPDGFLYVLLVDPSSRVGSIHRLVPSP